MKRRIPYGISNFERMIKQNYYYIDKTKYIEEIEKINFPAFLRPRRFGKTLFAQTLFWYYDIKVKDRFEELFGNLYIGKNPTPNHNKYFFLSLNMSGMSYAGESEEKVKEQFDENLTGRFQSFLLYYRDLLGIDKNYIDTFWDKYKNNASEGLEQLFGLVNDKNGKMFICIDEYDNFTNAIAIRYRYAAKNDNLYLNILGKGGFFRIFFEKIKEGTSRVVENIFITGIQPITISDMNSGFNIATWITFDERFSEMLGITNAELDNFLEQVYQDYDITFEKNKLKEIIKNNYDGYKFTPYGERLFNPMMTHYLIDSFIANNKMPQKFLDNNLRVNYRQISFIFGNNTQGRDMVIEQITRDKKYRVNSDPDIVFDMHDYKNGKYIVEGLFYLGILTYDNRFSLKIPNIVTYNMVLGYFERIKDHEQYNGFDTDWIFKYIFEGDIEEVIKGYFTKYIQKFPGVFFKNANESFYHGLLFHTIYDNLPKDLYEILPEYNLTNGTVDLMIRTFPHPDVPCAVNDIIEIKQVPKNASDKVFETKFIEAQKQMQNYLKGENRRGIAVCFRGNKDYKIKVYR